MLATVLPVAVFMLILYRLWSVYTVNSQYGVKKGGCRSDIRQNLCAAR